MRLLSLFKIRKPQKNKRIQLPSDITSFETLSKISYEYLNTQQETCMSDYKISTYENWYYDQLTGLLTFSDNGITKLIIEFEDVGSVSEVTNTFLWAWANPHTEEKVKSEIIKVKEYGIEHNFEKLITPKWTADQYDGWEMTAIAAYLLKAKGAYRVPATDDEKLFSFMIFKNITWPNAIIQ